MKHPLLMINLLQAYYWFDEAFQSAMQAAGSVPVTRSQSLVLTSIAAGEHRASRLARNLGVSRQAINQVLKSMQELGIVSARPDPDDSRALLVDFSADARPFREIGIRSLKRIEKELGQRIGAENLESLRHALAADWGDPPIEKSSAAPRGEARKRKRADAPTARTTRAKRAKRTKVASAKRG